MPAFAKMVGVSKHYINLIKNKGLEPSLKLAEKIEKATAGAVTVKELRKSHFLEETGKKKQNT